MQQLVHEANELLIRLCDAQRAAYEVQDIRRFERITFLVIRAYDRLGRRLGILTAM